METTVTRFHRTRTSQRSSCALWPILSSVNFFFVRCYCRFQLAAVNSGSINSDCTNLAPGQVICLGFDGEDCSTTQVVQPGDTCSSIAAANGLNQTILNLNNPQLDDACDIYVGEVRVFFFFSPCLLRSIGGLWKEKNPSPWHKIFQRLLIVIHFSSLTILI